MNDVNYAHSFIYRPDYMSLGQVKPTVNR